MANPNGKKGSQKHQDVQEAEKEKLKKEFKDLKNIDIETEIPVSTPNGKKKGRVADVAAYSKKNEIKFHKIVQVGKTDKAGKPVKRELEAIEDIEKHTDLKVKFVDYETYNLDKDGQTD